MAWGALSSLQNNGIYCTRKPSPFLYIWSLHYIHAHYEPIRPVNGCSTCLSNLNWRDWLMISLSDTFRKVWRFYLFQIGYHKPHHQAEKLQNTLIKYSFYLLLYLYYYVSSVCDLFQPYSQVPFILFVLIWDFVLFIYLFLSLHWSVWFLMLFYCTELNLTSSFSKALQRTQVCIIGVNDLIIICIILEHKMNATNRLSRKPHIPQYYLHNDYW